MADAALIKLNSLDLGRRGSEMGLGLGVLGILVVLLIPLPTFVLDFLIAINITVSVLLLLVSLYVRQPLSFTIFPTLILLLTLYRLSLNVASTRLILLNGGQGSTAAGQVIEAFGSFVVGGNYLVGAVIFLVLMTVQYFVVSLGSVRIAEVTARFTLDAMPGKQMSIDADLNAGIIDEPEARERREAISNEAEFYGSMDGATRFTQKDSIAALLITLINIIAGFGMGVGHHGMTWPQALQTFTILTIGDGLVTSLPSLLISVTSGIMTTRAASESNLARALGAQVFNDPRPIGLAAGALIVVAFLPGLPTLVPLILGTGIGAIALILKKTSTEPAELVDGTRDDKAAEAAEPSEQEDMEALLKVDPLGLELGYQLIQLVDNREGSDFLGRVKSIRRQLALDMGLIVPAVHITDNLQLKPKEYRILLKGVEVARSELLPECLLAINPGQTSEPLEGVETTEPTFGLPAQWIRPELREKAQLAGYTVVDNTTVLATHLTEEIKSHVHDLLGRQEVKALIDAVNETHPKVVEELIPNLLNIGQVQKVLQNLLRERVSIRDMVSILETLADFAPMTKNISLLTEYVRQALGRFICQAHLNDSGAISVFTLSPTMERSFMDAVTVTEQDSFLALEPELAKTILGSLQKGIEAGKFEGYPILLSPTEIRLHIRRFTERILPTLVVISHNEIPPNVKVVSSGVIEL